jgi:hypothetical protein
MNLPPEDSWSEAPIDAEIAELVEINRKLQNLQNMENLEELIPSSDFDDGELKDDAYPKIRQIQSRLESDKFDTLLVIFDNIENHYVVKEKFAQLEAAITPTEQDQWGKMVENDLFSFESIDHQDGISAIKMICWEPFFHITNGTAESKVFYMADKESLKKLQLKRKVKRTNAEASEEFKKYLDTYQSVEKAILKFAQDILFERFSNEESTDPTKIGLTRKNLFDMINKNPTNHQYGNRYNSLSRLRNVLFTKNKNRYKICAKNEGKTVYYYVQKLRTGSFKALGFEGMNKTTPPPAANIILIHWRTGIKLNEANNLGVVIIG